MHLALAQMKPEVDDKKGNLTKILEMSGMAAREGADLVVFPEMALTGYVCGKRFLEHAEPIDGPSVMRVAKEAKAIGTSILFGMPQLNGSLVHNSAVLGASWRSLPALPPPSALRILIEDDKLLEYTDDVDLTEKLATWEEY